LQSAEARGGLGMTQVETETAKLAPETRLGAVELTVTDLGRSVPFYQDAIGLKLHRAEDGRAVLGAGGEDLLVLVEEPEARRAGRHAGLYHFALLHPSRLELARAALRLAATQTPIQGASDHGISEAIYLPDPDGNGIELAADRPREQWPADLGYQNGPAPLDFPALVGTIEGEQPTPRVGEGLRMGHLHLHVGDIDEGLRFYRDLLGFEQQANLGTAAFVSAGGYHHHLGFNVWNGEGVGAPPEHTAGLRSWTVELPADDLARLRARLDDAGVAVEPREDGGFLVRDPWETAVAFTPIG